MVRCSQYNCKLLAPAQCCHVGTTVTSTNKTDPNLTEHPKPNLLNPWKTIMGCWIFKFIYFVYAMVKYDISMIIGGCWLIPSMSYLADMVCPLNDGPVIIQNSLPWITMDTVFGECHIKEPFFRLKKEIIGSLWPLQKDLFLPLSNFPYFPSSSSKLFPWLSCSSLLYSNHSNSNNCNSSD